MRWIAVLYNSHGCELARVFANTSNELNPQIAKWTLYTGDSIKIIGPLEER